ncbi:tetratricopeptide repeat protein [Parahaliea mediterranea]|uniref:tetratricopeptide repeat protein n=1 Tax=Parahaliea mediterranea TaxID=651086 RepID=UPI000E2F401A|nr:tetratricopeptide repeat protein [Parahaliea mediterranea]
MRLLATLCLGGLIGVTGAVPALSANNAAPWVGTTFRGTPCRGEWMNYGPYDYLQRNAIPEKLTIVERHHFTPAIEQLVAGEKVVPNIDYTLRAWPNHHRALYSIIRVYLMGNVRLGQHKGSTPECYLQRALNYSPEDPVAHMLFGIYLQRKGKTEQAMKMYQQAEKLDPMNMQVKYNLGLLFARQGDYVAAREYARQVYNAGFPLAGLRERLQSANQWQGVLSNNSASPD